MDRCRFIAAELVAALVVDNGSCMVKAGSLGLCSSCCVHLGRRLACDIRHYGRYGPEGQLCCEMSRSLPTSAVAYMAGFAGDDIFCCRRQAHGRCGPEGVFAGSGMCKAGIAGIFTSHAVFLLPFTGPDALHHGRYGPVVLGHGRSHAFVCNDICLWFRLHITVESPQLQFFFVRRHPCRGADADSHGPSPQSFPSCSTLTRWLTFAV